MSRGTSRPLRTVVHVTDVEGRWEKLETALAGEPEVRLDRAGRLEVRPGALFVYGGDAVDRGPAGRRVVATLLDAWRRQPDRVVLLAGNRDINKLRLARELRGWPPPAAPATADRAGLLRWILTRTMGAGQAFAHRQAELEAGGRAADDEAVVESFLEDVAPEGPLVEYLAACRLAHVEGATLFVHGAVTAESLGHVPGAPPEPDPRAWAGALNAFLAAQIAAFRADPDPAGPGPRPWQAIVDYQAPVPGTRQHQASVVYGRPTDERGNPHLPGPEVVARLRAAGLGRVVVGHTPSGDCPALLRSEDGFELVLADNSYGRLERDARVRIRPDGSLEVCGSTVLDDGVEAPVCYTLAPGEPSPLGRRTADGRLVKARLAGGDYLLFRARGIGEVEQVALPPPDTDALPLASPWWDAARPCPPREATRDPPSGPDLQREPSPPAATNRSGPPPRRTPARLLARRAGPHLRDAAGSCTRRRYRARRPLQLAEHRHFGALSFPFARVRGQPIMSPRCRPRSTACSTGSGAASAPCASWPASASARWRSGRPSA